MKARRLAAVLLIVGALASWVVEAIVAAVWENPGYDYIDDKISALGVPGAPWWRVMDTTWVVQGVAIAFVAVLLARPLSRTRARVVTIVGLAQGIGFVLFGAFHDSSPARSDGTILLYFVGAALGIVAGNALPIVVGPAWRQLGLPQVVGRLSVVLGVIGLATAIVTLGWAPLGLAERISVYTFLVWQVILGAALLGTRRPRPRPAETVATAR